MLYLAIQTFVLLLLTAAAFFALGYVFRMKFAGAKVVVSDHPPVKPPHRVGDDAEKVIRDLRTRLLEKERDLAEFLQTQEVAKPFPAAEIERLASMNEELLALRQAHASQVRRNTELEEQLGQLKQMPKAEPVSAPASVANAEVVERLESLEMEVALKNARIEQFQLESDQLRSDVTSRDLALEEMGAELKKRIAACESLEEQLEERRSETTKVQLADQELNELREELKNKVLEVDAYHARIESLETQLYEREYLLQVSRSKEEKDREELARAADAIWEDIEIPLEPEAEIKPVPPAPVPAPVVLMPDFKPQMEAMRQYSETLQNEFREKIGQLESTIESLRNDNEMALMTALDIARKAEEKPMPTLVEAPPVAVQWEPPPQMETIRERDALVAALWQEEKDGEKERLQRSVDALRHALDEKEKAIADMGGKIAELAGKVDPSLLGPDDLQQIKGIGPYTRKLLAKEFGIESFEQVANLTQSEIAKISEQLFFHDKIHREDWIGQAQELHKKKYG
jgi:predicted flap endonuclease-1-like 5' DNA nuclease